MHIIVNTCTVSILEEKQNSNRILTLYLLKSVQNINNNIV